MFNGSLSAKRVSNRELRRRAEDAIREGQKAFVMMLAVLAQSGGEITITTGTLDQLWSKLEDLDYVIVEGGAANERIIRLVEGKDEGEDTDGSQEDADGREAEDGEPTDSDPGTVETCSGETRDDCGDQSETRE